MIERAEPALPPRPESVSELEFVRDLTPHVFLRGLASGRKVLELGVGSGHGSWILRRACAASVLLADIDVARVGLARRLCAASGHVSAVAADAQDLPFTDESFDLTTCFEVIEHVCDPERLLAGLRRVTASGGLVLLSTPNRRLRLLPFQLSRPAMNFVAVCGSVDSVRGVLERLEF